MSKCRQCPIRSNCWDKDNCDDCAIGQKIEKMQRKIERLQNRLSKKEAQLEMYRGIEGCRLHQIEDAELQGRLLILDTPEQKAAIEKMIADGKGLPGATAPRECLKLHQLNGLNNVPVWAEGHGLPGYDTIGEWMICNHGKLTTTTGAYFLAADAIKNGVLFYTEKPGVPAVCGGGDANADT